MSTDHATQAEKRDALRTKIEASERRIAERTLAEQAAEAAQAATDYARANPLKVVGGAIVVGVAIGLMTNPGRAAAHKAASGAASAVGNAASGTANAVSNAAAGAGKAASNAVKSRGSVFIGLVTDALVAYGIKFIDQALDGAKNGQDRIEDLSDSATAKAREIRRDASYAVGTAADKTRTTARRSRRRAERAIRDLTERVRN